MIEAVVAVTFGAHQSVQEHAIEHFVDHRLVRARRRTQRTFFELHAQQRRAREHTFGAIGVRTEGVDDLAHPLARQLAQRMTRNQLLDGAAARRTQTLGPRLEQSRIGEAMDELHQIERRAVVDQRRQPFDDLGRERRQRAQQIAARGGIERQDVAHRRQRPREQLLESRRQSRVLRRAFAQRHHGKHRRTRSVEQPLEKLHRAITRPADIVEPEVDRAHAGHRRDRVRDRLDHRLDRARFDDLLREPAVQQRCIERELAAVVEKPAPLVRRLVERWRRRGQSDHATQRAP